MRRLSRPIRSLALLVLMLAWAAPAAAHAELESASPGPGDEVVTAPTVLVAVFSQDLDPSRSSLEVRDSAGNQVAEGGELGDGPRELRLALPELAPGVFEVRWTSYSAEDGELERGTYTFTVVAAPNTPAPTPAPSPSPGPSPDAGALDATVVVPIAVAIVVVAVVGLWLLRRRSA